MDPQTISQLMFDIAHLSMGCWRHCEQRKATQRPQEDEIIRRTPAPTPAPTVTWTWGDTERVRELIRSGVIKNSWRGNNGNGAVVDATNDGCMDAVRLLLAAGFDVDGPDSEGRTALFNASTDGCEDWCTLFLCYGANANARVNGIDALSIAVTNEHVDIVKLLVKYGANVNAIGEHDGGITSTPLMFAIGAGHLDIVEFLLQSGAKVSARLDVADSTVSMLALPFTESMDDNTRVNIAKLLLSYSASPNDPIGIPPLAMAAHCGCVAGVELLLKHGADPTVEFEKNGMRWTALDYAIQSENDAIIDLFLSMRPKLSMERSNGETVIHKGIAARIPLPLLESLLNMCDVDLINRPMPVAEFAGDTPLMIATYTNSLEQVRLLLKHGANVDARDGNKNTALMMAVATGNATIARMLVAAGASVTGTARNGATSLMAACELGRMDLVELCLDNGAMATPVATDGATALLRAVESEVVSVVEALFERKTGVESTLHLKYDEYDGKTVLDLAIEKQQPDMCRVLILAGAKCVGRRISDPGLEKVVLQAVRDANSMHVPPCP